MAYINHSLPQNRIITSIHSLSPSICQQNLPIHLVGPLGVSQLHLLNRIRIFLTIPHKIPHLKVPRKIELWYYCYFHFSSRAEKQSAFLCAHVVTAIR